MDCPKCRGSEENLVNLGQKEHYKHGNYRRYCCTSCGHVFKSIEKPDSKVRNRTEAGDYSNVKRLANG